MIERYEDFIAEAKGVTLNSRLREAVYENRPEEVSELIKKGANAFYNTGALLRRAVNMDFAEVTRILIEQGGLDPIDLGGGTGPVPMMISRYSIDVAKLYLEKGWIKIRDSYLYLIFGHEYTNQTSTQNIPKNGHDKKEWVREIYKIIVKNKEIGPDDFAKIADYSQRYNDSKVYRDILIDILDNDRSENQIDLDQLIWNNTINSNITNLRLLIRRFKDKAKDSFKKVFVKIVSSDQELKVHVVPEDRRLQYTEPKTLKGLGYMKQPNVRFLDDKNKSNIAGIIKFADKVLGSNEVHQIIYNSFSYSELISLTRKIYYGSANKKTGWLVDYLLSIFKDGNLFGQALVDEIKKYVPDDIADFKKINMSNNIWSVSNFLLLLLENESEFKMALTFLANSFEDLFHHFRSILIHHTRYQLKYDSNQSKKPLLQAQIILRKLDQLSSKDLMKEIKERDLTMYIFISQPMELLMSELMSELEKSGLNIDDANELPVLNRITQKIIASELDYGEEDDLLDLF